MLGEVLGHPLVILLAGGALSGWLVPLIARRWQDRRKALELKVDLIERLAAAVTKMFMASQFVEVGAASQSQKDYDEAYRSWQYEKAKLTALLRAYFRSETVNRHWVRCRALTTAYYVQSGIGDDAKRRRYLEIVGVALYQGSEPVDLSETGPGEIDITDHATPTQAPDLGDRYELRAEIQRELDHTVQAVLEAHISVA